MVPCPHLQTRGYVTISKGMCIKKRVFPPGISQSQTALVLGLKSPYPTYHKSGLEFGSDYFAPRAVIDPGCSHWSQTG